MTTWKYIKCGLCDWKAYCPIQKRNRRLRQHLYSKHRTGEELKKIRNDIRDLKACAKAMKIINTTKYREGNPYD